MPARVYRIILINNTPFTFKKIQENLADGEFTGALVPPETIQPGEEKVWQSESNGFMIGTEGHLIYEIDNRTKDHISINWENPWLGATNFNVIMQVLKPNNRGSGSTFESFVDVNPEDTDFVVRISGIENLGDAPGPIDTEGWVEILPGLIPFPFPLPQNVIDHARTGIQISHRQKPASAVSTLWKEWEDLGGVTTDAPTVASWGLNRLDCFVRGTDDHMWHKWWDGQWFDWENLGGIISSAPAAVSWGPNRIDCFARGADNHMWHKWWDGQWFDWEDLGGIITSAPTVASWGPNRLDCFARGTDDHMWHKWWDGSGWSDWEDLGGNLASAPAAVSWGPNRIDCFVRGTDNHMWHKWWDGSGWSDWEDLGGQIQDAPAVSSWAPNRLDCFARGSHNWMWHKWWDGSGWSDWEDLGGVILSAPAAVSWGPERIDCFARGADNHMWHKWYN